MCAGRAAGEPVLVAAGTAQRAARGQLGRRRVRHRRRAELHGHSLILDTGILIISDRAAKSKAVGSNPGTH